MTSNILDIIAFGVGFKYPRKIHLNTQCHPPPPLVPTALSAFHTQGAAKRARDKVRKKESLQS